MRARSILAVALLPLTGCAATPIVSTGCIQTVGDSGSASSVHLVKAGQLVPDDSLLTATADDPESHRLARLARRHALAGLSLGIIGAALTIVGLSVTIDAAQGPSTRELAVGVPFAGVGVGALIAAAIELHNVRVRGLQALQLYNERHPDCH
jgi:hypothetical protein